MYNEFVNEEVDNIKRHLSVIEKDLDRIVKILDIDPDEVEIWQKTMTARIMTDNVKGKVGYLLNQCSPIHINSDGGLLLTSEEVKNVH